mmetsp:Transcript_118694/g.378441  ORF Transcript_118694/g.378441 Transcript_118694/m.378441 type:complete len:269 (+) Transcript_118694:260-1066(+)
MGSPMQPNFIFTSLPIFPDSTSPVCKPIRISSVGRPRCWRSTFRATSARCCANAAAQAFAACASTSPGVFQKTRRPSPRISETTPSKSSTEMWWSRLAILWRQSLGDGRKVFHVREHDGDNPFVHVHAPGPPRAVHDIPDDRLGHKAREALDAPREFGEAVHDLGDLLDGNARAHGANPGRAVCVADLGGIHGPQLLHLLRQQVQRPRDHACHAQAEADAEYRHHQSDDQADIDRPLLLPVRLLLLLRNLLRDPPRNVHGVPCERGRR